jgi:hypothetical protein
MTIHIHETPAGSFEAVCLQLVDSDKTCVCQIRAEAQAPSLGWDRFTR